MNPKRKTALALMVILAMFSLALTARMVAIHRHQQRAGVLALTELDRLKEQIKAEPKNQKLQVTIRALDVRMREDYFRSRRQFNFGAYLLIAALIGFLMSARLFVEAVPEPTPDLEQLSQGLPPEVLDARARRVALAVGLVTTLMLAAFATEGLIHRDRIPPAPKIVKRLSVAPTTSTVALARPTVTLTPTPTLTPSPSPTVTPTPTPPATPSPAPSPSPVAVAMATPSSQLAPTMAPSPATTMTFKDSWPCFRGAGNLGQAPAGVWPTTWNVKSGQNIDWAVNLPADGKSSPILWQDRLFLTGATKEQQNVMCFDRASGKLLWNTPLKAPPGAEAMEIFDDTGFAAPTPSTDGQRVYAIFASGLVAALDFAGKPVWTRPLGIPESQYGYASSLILHEGTLIVLLDQAPEAEANKSRLIGLDAATGNEKWSTPRPVPNSWASPSIIKAGGRFELITCANPWVIAYDPASGKELWKVDGYGGEIGPSPAFDGERIFVANDSALMFAIKPGGSGDVTKTHVAWQAEDGLPDISSPVSDGKRVLLVQSSGSLTCYNAADGKKVWEQSVETSFSASPVAAGKTVYLCGQDGVTRLFDLSDAYRELSRGDIGEPILATPAFGDGRIYIRGDKRLYCIAQATASTSATAVTPKPTPAATPAPSPSPIPTAPPAATQAAPTSATVAQTPTPTPVPSPPPTPLPAAPTAAAASTAPTSTTAPTAQVAPTTHTVAAPPTAPVSATEPGTWPCFRGPGNIGIARAGDWPTTWSVAKNLNVAWKTEIPAEGNSSPIVWRDHIFLTGSTKEQHNVMCFDRASGKLLWNAPLAPPPGTAEMEIFDETGLAAPTPATDGQRVYAIFASGLVAALDFAGKPVWTRPLGIPESQYGYSSSLILHEGTLIVLFDQAPEAEASKSRLIGLDAATGNEKWSTPRPVPNSWASPSIIKAGGRFELITCANPWVIAYDPASGKELWKADGLGGDVAPSPAFDGERVIVSQDSAITMAVRPGGSGDVTQTHIVWKSEDGLPDISSPVGDGKWVLLVRNSGDLTCLAAADGKRIWEKTVESSFSASPVLAGKLVYLCGQDGVTFVFELGDTYKLHARGDVGEPIHVTPAFADGRIFIRGSKHLFCIGAKP